MTRRRPLFGWIAFTLVLGAYLALGGVAAYAYLQTQDAFIQTPPWWMLTSSIAITPVALLCGVGMLSGIIGAARREKPGWPAITAMIFALPGFGYVAFAAYVSFVVTVSCAGPAGACS